VNNITNIEIDGADMSEVLDAPSTAMTVIPASAVSTIVSADTDDILSKIAAKVAAFKPDISTPRGRDEMRSLAHEIAKSKVALIKIGKGLTEGWRKSTKAVNEECNIIETRMDELRDKVRQPLTEWENAEKARVAAHEAALAAISETPDYGQVETSAELQHRLDYLLNYPARDWQEFGARAADSLGVEISRTRRLLEVAQKREVEAAELARLRAEEAERQRLAEERAQREREERIAAEAAARAKREAEEEAERQRAAVEQRAQAEAKAAAERAEAERREIERREKEAREAAERAEAQARKAEADRIAAAEQAKRDQIAAEQRAREREAELARKAEADRIAAEQKAERDRIAAIEAERKRIADEKAAEEAEAQRRAANKAHRASVNRDILAAFVGCGAAEELSKALIAAIARGEVPHVSISY
jgi:colicin import membrane protein